jgi:hypothetical protein
MFQIKNALLLIYTRPRYRTITMQCMASSLQNIMATQFREAVLHVMRPRPAVWDYCYCLLHETAACVYM